MDKGSENLRIPPEDIVRRRKQKGEGMRSNDIFTQITDRAVERDWEESLKKLKEKGLISGKKEGLTVKDSEE